MSSSSSLTLLRFVASVRLWLIVSSWICRCCNGGWIVDDGTIGRRWCLSRPMTISTPSAVPSSLFQTKFVGGYSVVSRPKLTSHVLLLLSKNNNDSNGSGHGESKKVKPQGVYVRPSAAIERGSGFFIPGLEGSRLRVVIALFLLGTSAFLSTTTTITSATTTTELSHNDNTLTLGITILYALLLLWQAAIDFQLESGRLVAVAVDATSLATTKAAKSRGAGAPVVVVDHQWSFPISYPPSWQDKVEWAASSFLSMTPATTMLLLEQDYGIVYQGRKEPLTKPSNGELQQQQQFNALIQAGVQSALATLAQSSSGRVALPTTLDPQPHPATQVLTGLQQQQQQHQLVSQQPSSIITFLPKSIVLQRISDTSCWMVLSEEQRIEAFTSFDWKWLGRFAQYVNKTTAVR